MRKVLVSLRSLVTLVSLVSLTSCKKEEVGNGTQFRATMEDCSSVKTTLDGTALNWVAGDLIKVYGTTGSGIYSATPQTLATVAVFDNVSGETGNAPFRAYYPSALTTDGVNITLPATQTAGALFLPATGFRGLTTVENAGHWGYYWSSTLADKGTQARYLSVKTSLSAAGVVSATGTTDPWFGYSVRLVKNSE